MTAARAMNPRPATMPVIHLSANSVAEAMPQRAPLMRTPAYRMSVTFTPSVSAASGFSPTLRRRRPKTVRYRTNQLTATTGMSQKARELMPRSLGKRYGLIFDCVSAPKKLWQRKRERPMAKTLIATPDTTWSTLKVTVTTAWMRP